MSYNPTCFSGELNANYANKFTREIVEVKKMEKARCANPSRFGSIFPGKQPLILMIFEQNSHVLSESTLKVEYHTYPTCSPKK